MKPIKPVIAAIIAATVTTITIPAMAAEPQRQSAADGLSRLTVTETQSDAPGYTQKSFDYPKDRPDLGADANQWDWVYARDMTDIRRDKDGDVTHGVLKKDPYTGLTIEYNHKAGAVDVEHIVARSEAWDSGASKWTQERRDEFANDPLEIMVVSASGNRTHGDKDAARWLPSTGGSYGRNPSYDCAYVARQIAVKLKYGLTVDQAEHDAMSRVLDTCPAQTMPLNTDGEYWSDTVKPAAPAYSKTDLQHVAVTLAGQRITLDPNRPDVTITPEQAKATPQVTGLPAGWTARVKRSDALHLTITAIAPNGRAIMAWGLTAHAPAATPQTSKQPAQATRPQQETQEKLAQTGLELFRLIVAGILVAVAIIIAVVILHRTGRHDDKESDQ